MDWSITRSWFSVWAPMAGTHTHMELGRLHFEIRQVIFHNSVLPQPPHFAVTGGYIMPPK